MPEAHDVNSLVLATFVVTLGFSAFLREPDKGRVEEPQIAWTGH